MAVLDKNQDQLKSRAHNGVLLGEKKMTSAKIQTMSSTCATDIGCAVRCVMRTCHLRLVPARLVLPVRLTRKEEECCNRATD